MRLSIVVNMFNTAKFLPKCMDSLLHQDITPSSYEIILVDDGSTDNSLELANEYVNQSSQCADWPNIKICAHANKGLAGARNTGVDAAIGQYLCFVDPDDYIEKNSLASLLQQMDDEQLDMLRFNYQKIDEVGNKLKDSEMEANFDYSPNIMSGRDFLIKRLTTTCYVWAYIYRLDIIKQNNIRFIEGCYFDDTPWLPRVLQVAERINCTSVRHQYYLQRSGSLVHTVNKKSVLHKVKGQLELISILKNQMESIDRITQVWYEKMVSHICISLLTSVAVIDFKHCNSYLRQVQHLFPLNQKGLGKKMSNKIRILNICPKLFLWLIHIKNLKYKNN